MADSFCFLTWLSTMYIFKCEKLYFPVYFLPSLTIIYIRIIPEPTLHEEFYVHIPSLESIRIIVARQDHSSVANSYYHSIHIILKTCTISFMYSLQFCPIYQTICVHYILCTNRINVLPRSFRRRPIHPKLENHPPRILHIRRHFARKFKINELEIWFRRRNNGSPPAKHLTFHPCERTPNFIKSIIDLFFFFALPRRMHPEGITLKVQAEEFDAGEKLDSPREKST